MTLNNFFLEILELRLFLIKQNYYSNELRRKKLFFIDGKGLQENRN